MFVLRLHFGIVQLCQRLLAVWKWSNKVIWGIKGDPMHRCSKCTGQVSRQDPCTKFYKKKKKKNLAGIKLHPWHITTSAVFLPSWPRYQSICQFWHCQASWAPPFLLFWRLIWWIPANCFLLLVPLEHDFSCYRRPRQLIQIFLANCRTWSYLNPTAKKLPFLTLPSSLRHRNRPRTQDCVFKGKVLAGSLWQSLRRARLSLVCQSTKLVVLKAPEKPPASVSFTGHFPELINRLLRYLKAFDSYGLRLRKRLLVTRNPRPRMKPLRGRHLKPHLPSSWILPVPSRARAKPLKAATSWQNLQNEMSRWHKPAAQDPAASERGRPAKTYLRG